MLLSDERVKRLLTDELVPSWESVGTPAKVTIELGDGSTMRRTLGGNTAMYLCDPSGRVIDIYPGVYTADDWLNEVADGLALWAEGPISDQALVQFHSERAGGNEGATHSASKRVVEAPMLSLFGAVTPPPGYSREAMLEDVSKYPGTAAELRKLYLDPSQRAISPLDFGLKIVIQDSKNNVERVRPLVHSLFERTHGKSPDAWKVSVFSQLLGVGLDDPTLGLRQALPPGTWK